MSNVMRTILGAGTAMSLALSVHGAAVVGTPAVSDCTGLVNNVAESGELYVVKIGSAPATNFSEDFLWDLEEKGEARIVVGPGGTNLQANGYSADDTWSSPQLPSDVHHVIITYPRTSPTTGDRVVVDSGLAGEFVFGASIMQTVGNSIATGVDQSIGLTIPGNQTRIPVRFAGPGSTPRGNFPSGTVSNAIVIAFAPIAEITEASPVGDPQCTVGGRNAFPNDPATTNPTPTIGAIIGYNVYRIPATGGNTGSPADFMAAPNYGWVGFADLRTFRMATADTTNPGPAGSELNAMSDIVGLQNVDGRMYSGDEVVIFQDSLRDLSGAVRPNAPDPANQDYWYAVQPVLQGRISDFVNVSFTNNSILSGDHTMDSDGDTVVDAVSLDTVGAHNTPEFISPQAEANPTADGLGLTVDGRLLLSAPMFWDNANPLPAGGQVRLTGVVAGNDVNLQFSTGLEAGSVQGYNVDRMVAGNPVRVNDQLILAQGSESNVYQLVDDATAARRLARGGKVQYTVEIVYSDGTPSQTVGPFDVSFNEGQPARRRR